MSLPQVVVPGPGRGGFLEWSFWHENDHTEIRQAIQKKLLIILPVYILIDVTEKVTSDWLRRHQQAHNDFTQVLGISGNDLESVDFQDAGEAQVWFNLQFEEHRQARAVLGI